MEVLNFFGDSLSPTQGSPSRRTLGSGEGQEVALTIFFGDPVIGGDARAAGDLLPPTLSKELTLGTEPHDTFCLTLVRPAALPPDAAVVLAVMCVARDGLPEGEAAGRRLGRVWWEGRLARLSLWVLIVREERVPRYKQLAGRAWVPSLRHDDMRPYRSPPYTILSRAPPLAC